MKKIMEKHPVVTVLILCILVKSLITETIESAKTKVVILVVGDAIDIPESKIEETD